jgi:membrane protease YdiL (CAAX protease family)
LHAGGRSAIAETTTAGQGQAMNGSRSGFRWDSSIRSVVEIGVIIFYLVYAPAGLEWVVLRSGLAVDGLVQVAGISGLTIVMFLLTAAMVKLRGQSFADVGLRRPRSISLTILIGATTAALVFLAVELANKVGLMHRDLSDVASLRTWPVLLAWIAMVILVSGFVEEFVYRGFMMDRIASVFGSSRGAWIAAFFLQAVIFGLAHAYGALQLELFAGAFALIYAALYLWQGNLWAPIVTHGLFDASRVVFAYWLLTHA